VGWPAALGWTGTELPSAFWGAVGGYLSLWLIYWGFKLLTGKEGMGYGDFKLCRAWRLVRLACAAAHHSDLSIGAVIGIAMKLSSGLREGGYPLWPLSGRRRLPRSP
jgi:leader peptidase (prepilin peptidase)/N-methyltransferase